MENKLNSWKMKCAQEKKEEFHKCRKYYSGLSRPVTRGVSSQYLFTPPPTPEVRQLEEEEEVVILGISREIC